MLTGHGGSCTEALDPLENQWRKILTSWVVNEVERIQTSDDIIITSSLVDTAQ